jgi:hypothetical protein
MKRVLVIAGLALMFAGCYNDKGDQLYPAPTTPTSACDTTNQTISYTATISGIMAASCATAGCHDAATQQGGYNLSSYPGVHMAATTDNKLLGSIQQLSGYSPMPQGAPKLSDCQIGLVTKWVNQGAPNN